MEVTKVGFDLVNNQSANRVQIGAQINKLDSPKGQKTRIPSDNTEDSWL